MTATAAAPRVIEVPFHVGDFLSGTMHMDATETGAYWMLCVAHYQAGPQGLPNDDAKLARIARVTPCIWKRIRPTVAAKFSVEGDFLRHKRVREILEKIADKSAEQKAKALKRWDPGPAAASSRQSRGPANQKPITDKVIKPEEGDSSARDAPPGYSVETAVRYPVLLKAKARAKELNRDFGELCRLYNNFVSGRGIPGDADAAFLGWIEKFTEGKRL